MTVLLNFQGYEERQYPATTWVSSSMEGPSLTQATREMYQKLFAYKQGNNAKGLFESVTIHFISLLKWPRLYGRCLKISKYLE